MHVLDADAERNEARLKASADWVSNPCWNDLEFHIHHQRKQMQPYPPIHRKSMYHR